jgi:hypothetical protein
MSEKQESPLSEALAAMRQNAKERRANQPKFTAQMGALGREAKKDINNTLMQVFFDQPAGMNEPGSPLSPTQAMVTEDLTGKEVNATKDLINKEAVKEKNLGVTKEEVQKELARTRGSNEQSRGR